MSAMRILQTRCNPRATSPLRIRRPWQTRPGEGIANLYKYLGVRFQWMHAVHIGLRGLVQNLPVLRVIAEVLVWRRNFVHAQRLKW